MAVTLDGIDIETVIDISERQSPRINNFPLGIHSMQLTQNLKAQIHQFDVAAIWSAGSTDYDNKKRKLHNIAESGLPVWFDGKDWAKNQEIFGRVSDVSIRLTEGRVDVYEVRFLITSVIPWGYVFVQDDGVGDFRIYDLDKHVQSRTLNTLLRRCNWSRTATTLTYSIFVKNVGATGTVKLELMVPDGIVAVDITATGWTIAAGDVGASGFSSSPGTKRRVTLSKSIIGGVEEQLDITIASLSGKKTSYIDGSIDETAA